MANNQWVYRLISDSITCYPFVVAITGPSNSGKTTFGSEMLSFFGSDTCLHLDLDDYLIPRSERFRLNITGYDPLATKMGDVRRDIIALMDGCDIEKPVYDHVEGCSLTFETVVSKDIIVMNGSPALYDGLRDLSHFSLFLDGNKPELVAAKRKRDREKRGYSELEAKKLWDGLDTDYALYLEPMKEYSAMVLDVGEDYGMRSRVA